MTKLLPNLIIDNFAGNSVPPPVVTAILKANATRQEQHEAEAA